MKNSLAIIIFITFSSIVFAQEKEEVIKGEPVIVEEIELFRIHSTLGPFSAKERATVITQRLNKLLENQAFDRDKLRIVTAEFTTDIIYANSIIMSITATDAIEEGKSSEELAKIYIDRIVMVLKTHPQHAIINKPEDIYVFFITNKDTIIKTAFAILSGIAFIIIYYFILKLFSKLYASVEIRKGTTFKSIVIKNNEIISDSTLVYLVILCFKAIKFLIVIGLFYLIMTTIFILFPWAKSSSAVSIIKSVLLIILTILVGIGILKSIKISMKALEDNVSDWKGTVIKPIKIKTVILLTAEQSVNIIKKLIFALNILLNIFLLYIIVPIILSYFEFTSTWADTLFGYILTPLKMILSAFISFLPNIFFIAVTLLIVQYIIKLAKLISDEIGNGNISIPNFHKEWAEPTYKIVRSLILIFTLIIVFPYIPGSQSEAFKGVSVFLGVLFSLGSTSIIANIVAGTILTYMHAFKVGDLVKIGNTLGDIIEKTLLVTRIKTATNIVITIPNSIVMGSHIINYTTSSSQGEGLILNTTVRLGYSVPWKKVHETLIGAALLTSNVKKEPAPFVLQTSLDDFYVSYELNCYTDNPEIMARTYSELHQNVQDKCNEAGIEILSPHYATIRNGNVIKKGASKNIVKKLYPKK